MEDYQLQHLLQQVRLDQHHANIEAGKRKDLTDYLTYVLKSGCPRDIKDEAILALFSPEFVKRVRTEAIERMIFEVLRRDGDIFKMIESLVSTINNQQEQLENIFKSDPYRSFMH